MKTKAKELLDAMKKLLPRDIWEAPQKQAEITFHFAELLVHLSEEAEKQADKMARFTRWLIYFTVALVFIGIVQNVIMFLKP